MAFHCVYALRWQLTDELIACTSAWQVFHSVHTGWSHAAASVQHITGTMLASFKLASYASASPRPELNWP